MFISPALQPRTLEHVAKVGPIHRSRVAAVDDPVGAHFRWRPFAHCGMGVKRWRTTFHATLGVSWCT